MLYALLILAIIVILLVKAFRPFRYTVNSTSSYSWTETLFPFNSAPINIYRHLSPENKGVFWSLASSTIIGVLTCWLGFSVQFFVLDSTQIETQKLAHYQVVDKFRPMYLELFDSCSIVVHQELYNLGANQANKKKGQSTSENIITTDEYIEVLEGKRLSDEKEAKSNVNFFRFMSDRDNWSKIIYASQKCIDISASIAPYVDAEKSDSLLSNNFFMLSGSRLLCALNDTVLLDSASFIQDINESYIEAMVLGTVSLNSNVREIAQSLYSLYRTLSDMDDMASVVSSMQAINMLVLMPMMKNAWAIQEEFIPQEETNEPMKQSMKVLFVSLFIGYMLFRIILMRCLDKKSLEPNPRMSQSDLDKLNRELVSEKKEKKQMERNADILEMKMKVLSEELDKEKMKAKDCQEKINEMAGIIDTSNAEITLLRDKVSELESINISLLEQINPLDGENVGNE